MNKILMFSHIELFGYGGGCLENRKYYDGLKYYANGKEVSVKVISLDRKFEDSFDIVIKKNNLLDVGARLMGHSTYLYFTWKVNKKKIIEYKPDMVVLGRSRMGFIAKEIKRALPECYVITNMENVEYDYVDAYFANKNGLIKMLLSNLEKCCIKRDEKAAVYHSDALDYLTERDVYRTHELYGNFKNRETIIPICIDRKTMLNKLTQVRNVVFIGSLDYGSNLDALMWFIENVWEKYYLDCDKIQFLIGGSNAHEELINRVSNINNIVIYNNFARLEDIIPIESMVVAPIQSGAGMKVKVAETLSMGLLIAASDEALIGYEKALSESDKGIIRANTAKEYHEAIEQYLKSDTSTLNRICMENMELYHKYFSYETSRREIACLCEIALE